MAPLRADLDMAHDARHGGTQVLGLGLHAETDRPEGRDHYYPMLQLMQGRGLATCLKPDHQAPHLSLASFITRVPEQDDLVPSPTSNLPMPECTLAAVLGLCLWMRTNLRKRRPPLETIKA